ncbi:MAG: hypothetical protein OSA99_15150 [Acidimicrobiales bacterium]|nr:hypothetical protein [Acidimicrobiales bacterium]
MGALAVLVEDHDHFGRCVQRVDRVWGHGRELGRLALLDIPDAVLRARRAG